jgi:hypothetical protein
LDRQGHRHHGGLVNVVPPGFLRRIGAAGEPLLDLGDAGGQNRVGLGRIRLEQGQRDHCRLSDRLAGRPAVEVLDCRENRRFLLFPLSTGGRLRGRDHTEHSQKNEQ